MTLKRGQYNFTPQKRVIFGAGSIEDLAAALADLGVARPFLLTSNTLATQTPLTELVGKVVGDGLAGLWHQTAMHVPRETVIAAADAARAAGADSVISFGGGSVTDLGKAVTLALAEDIRTPAGFDAFMAQFEYPDRLEIPGLKHDPIPHVAIPTTLSGGEFTGFIGITDRVRKVKDLYIDPRYIPGVVLMDADLLKETPRWLLVSSGIRAVDHCVEAICSSTAQIFTDTLCSDALKRLVDNLPKLAADNWDSDAVTECQIAAWESVCGLANVLLGLSHGIGHQLGARCAVPHGYTSCVMLPTVMTWNLGHTEEPQARVAALVGVPTAGLSTKQAAEKAAPAIRDFISSLGMPTTLREVGVTEDDFDGIANDAIADLIVAGNPRPVTGREDIIALLKAAY